VAIGTEGMAVPEAVTGQPFAEHDGNLGALGVQDCITGLGLGQSARGQR